MRHKTTQALVVHAPVGSVGWIDHWESAGKEAVPFWQQEVSSLAGRTCDSTPSNQVKSSATPRATATTRVVQLRHSGPAEQVIVGCRGSFRTPRATWSPCPVAM